MVGMMGGNCLVGAIGRMVYWGKPHLLLIKKAFALVIFQIA